MKNEWKRGQKIEDQKNTGFSNRNSKSKEKKSVIKKENYKRQITKTKNYTEKNIIHDEDFPQLGDVVQSVETLDNNYIKICENLLETNENKLQEGWIELSKKNNIVQFTRNGKDYLPIEKYNEKQDSENNDRIDDWEKVIDHLTNMYEQRSIEHYNIYGNLDGYTLAKIEREKYEIYAAQFDEEEDEEEEFSDEYYDSDNSSLG